MVNIPGAHTMSQETRRLGQDMKSTFSRGDSQSDEGAQKHYGDTDQSYESSHKNFEDEQYQQPDFYQQGRSTHGQQQPPNQTINAGAGGATYGGQVDPTSFGGHPAPRPEQSAEKSYRQPRYQTYSPSHPSSASHAQAQPQAQEPLSAHPQPQQASYGQQRPQYGDEGQRSFNDAQQDAQQGARKKSFMGKIHEKLSSI
ncbi:hypothetical protein KEM56_002344 [Ascosphaera pollenicola]|nr:hypothetical protein KEM56_002344 [Ascosphaera pollenicola]